MKNTGNSESDEVAIFWDYENCPTPTNASGFSIVDNIRSVAQTFGSIKLFKAYLEVSEHVSVSRTLLLRSELQSSGVSLTDCPHNGKKDVADKMIIVDMLAYAIDNPAPSTIVLISGDRDFAYALSILRLRRYHIVLITLSNAHPSLRAQASLCFDWISDILGPIDSNFLHQPSSPRRGKTSVPPAHDNVLSDSKAHNPSKSLFQDPYDEEPATRVESINSFQDKKKCKENCLTPPKHSFRLDFLPPGLEKSKKQSAASSMVSNILQNEPELPTRYSPVTSSCHAHLNDSINASLTMTSHDSDSSQTTLSSSESTPKLAPLGSIMSSQYSAYVPLRGSSSLPNLALEHKINNRTEPVPFESTMQPRTLPVELDLRGSLPPSHQGAKYQCLSTVNPMDHRTSNPDLLPAHMYAYPPTNFTAPLPAPALSFMPPLSLSHATMPATAQTSVKVANPPQLPPTPAAPDKFKILVRCLKKHRAKGILRPLRGTIALEVAHNGTTYREAGVSKFREYSTMALEAGIIELGGLEGTAWISLREPWC